MSRNAGWFRFYDRMIDSPQVLELNDTEFRLLVSIWCLASGSEQRGTLPFTPRTLQRRALPDHSVDEVEAMVTHLVALDLLAPLPDGGGYAVVRWDSHQYEHPSWTPEARRQQKRNERQAQRATSQECRNDVASGRNIDTEAEAEADADADSETDTEPTSKDTVAAAGETGSSSGGDPHSLAVLCAQVTQAAHLNGHEPQALARSLARYRARASPDDLLAEAGKAAEWVREKPRRKMSVRFLDNWFKRAFDEHEASNHHGSIQGSAASNGHRAAGQPQTLAGFAGAGVEAPDPTERGDGIYAGWVKHGRPAGDAG